MEIENQELRRLYNKNQYDTFFVGTVIGVIMTLIGLRTYKMTSIERIKYKVRRLKESASDKINKNIYDVEDSVDEFVNEFEEKLD